MTPNELLALNQADLMGVARNPLRDAATRKAAWDRFNVLCWLEAHVERDFPLKELPAEYRDAVHMEMRRQTAPLLPPSQPALTRGPV